MSKSNPGLLAAVGAVLLAASSAQAANVFVAADITVSETWTPDNTYILTRPIYVTNGATLTIDGATVYIGRAAGNAVRIDDPSVSRLHCSLSARSGGGGAVVIADVGSINGTYVNERLMGRDEACSLSTGDVVGIGDFRLTVSEIA